MVIDWQAGAGTLVSLPGGLCYTPDGVHIPLWSSDAPVRGIVF